MVVRSGPRAFTVQNTDRGDARMRNGAKNEGVTFSDGALSSVLIVLIVLISKRSVCRLFQVCSTTVVVQCIVESVIVSDFEIASASSSFVRFFIRHRLARWCRERLRWEVNSKAPNPIRRLEPPMGYSASVWCSKCLSKSGRKIVKI